MLFVFSREQLQAQRRNWHFPKCRDRSTGAIFQNNSSDMYFVPRRYFKQRIPTSRATQGDRRSPLPNYPIHIMFSIDYLLVFYSLDIRWFCGCCG